MVEHFFIGCDRRWMFDMIPKPMLSVNAHMARALDLTPKEVSWVDSGAFSVVRKHGAYNFTHEWYRACVAKMHPTFYTQMDWPCEPLMLERTRLTVAQHQVRSITSARECSTWEVGDSLFVPTIQGWTVDEYLACAEQLEAEGLWRPYMAVGSVCRRGSAKAVERVLWALREFSPRTKYHGFGVKSVDKLLRLLWSADSYAWRYQAWMAAVKKNGPTNKDRGGKDVLAPQLQKYVLRTKAWERRGTSTSLQSSLRGLDRGGEVFGPAE